AHTEPGAVPKCFNGLEAKQDGVYLATAWLGWEANAVGARELTLFSYRPSKGQIQLAALAEQGANPDVTAGVEQTASAIGRLQAGDVVGAQAYQDSGGALGFAGGGLQIAFLGS